MSGQEARSENLKKVGCGGCIAGTFGGLLAWVVLVLAGVTQFLLAASFAAALGIGATFAAWLHGKLPRSR